MESQDGLFYEQSSSTTKFRNKNEKESQRVEHGECQLAKRFNPQILKCVKWRVDFPCQPFTLWNQSLEVNLYLA